MDKVVVYNYNNELFIMSPAVKENMAHGCPTFEIVKDMTEEEHLDWVIGKDVPPGSTDILILNREDLPQDRYFMPAWKIENGSVVVNMEKARVVHMNYIRTARDERLSELDKRKYGEEYDDERQALRDLPTVFDLSGAETPEELKQLWPLSLPRTQLVSNKEG